MNKKSIDDTDSDEDDLVRMKRFNVFIIAMCCKKKKNKTGSWKLMNNTLTV